MGQYFILVNLDKKEYVSPWDIGGVAKLCEWCGNPQAGVIPFLLAQGPDDGVLGSYERYLKEKRLGEKLPHPEWGRWAGDRIVLIGDYEDSKLYEKARSEYENISEWLLKEFNKFMGYDLREQKLPTLRPDVIIVSRGIGIRPEVKSGKDAMLKRS